MVAEFPIWLDTESFFQIQDQKRFFSLEVGKISPLVHCLEKARTIKDDTK
jgi:hypothetical protein